jgi:hypothetical protein
MKISHSFDLGTQKRYFLVEFSCFEKYRVLVFNATFNNISVISWRKIGTTAIHLIIKKQDQNYDLKWGILA